jgi:enoyl-[acyl-carrier protein] reductase I
VQQPDDIENLASALKAQGRRLDVVVHSLAAAKHEDLNRPFVETSREGFQMALDVSAYSLLAISKALAPLMTEGGSIMTLTYLGSTRVVTNYNIMGVAKAALESAVRYLAAELGPKGIRVHAISPGPLATRAASGIPQFDGLLEKAKVKAPAHQLVSIDDVGVATAFLAHDAARLITGETLYIDGGYHIID